MLQPVNEGLNKLLMLATELERVDAFYDAGQYDQGAFIHECGTPACAFGHYIAAFKADSLRFRKVACDCGHRDCTINVLRFEAKVSGVWVDATYIGMTLWERIQDEFGLTVYEAARLFDADGCGNAETAGDAALYIRDFVARKIEAMVPTQ